MATILPSQLMTEGVSFATEQFTPELIWRLRDTMSDDMTQSLDGFDKLNGS